MVKFIKSIFVAGGILLVAVNVWALQIGSQVYMEDVWTVPYEMTDVSTGITYKTFCLESGQYFTPKNYYNVSSVGDYATGGGGGDVTAFG